MTSIWLDEPDSEAIDLFGIDDAEEDYFDDGSSDAEASLPRATLARRAHRARIERAARARAARSRALTSWHPATPAAALRRTQAAVVNVDVDNKVQADAFSRALQREARRIDGAHAAVAGITVGRQLEASFPVVNANGVVGALFRGAPLLLLRSGRRGSGVGSLLANPQLVGVGLIAALVVAREAKNAGWFAPAATGGTP